MGLGATRAGWRPFPRKDTGGPKGDPRAFGHNHPDHELPLLPAQPLSADRLPSGGRSGAQGQHAACGPSVGTGLPSLRRCTCSLLTAPAGRADAAPAPRPPGSRPREGRGRSWTRLLLAEGQGAGCSSAPQRPPLSRRLREEPGGQAQTAGRPCRGTEPRRGWGRRVGGGRAGPAAGGSVTWASPLASASPPACSDRQTRWSLRALHRLWCWTGQGHEGGLGAGEATCCPGRTVNIGGQKPMAARGLPGPS